MANDEGNLNFVSGRYPSKFVFSLVLVHCSGGILIVNICSCSSMRPSPIKHNSPWFSSSNISLFPSLHFAGLAFRHVLTFLNT